MSSSSLDHNQLLRLLMRPLVELYIAAAELWRYNPAYLFLAVMFVYHAIRWVFMSMPKKKFTAERCTNIMITGGAMGLGKLLAEQFVRRNPLNSVNLIIVDIRADLEAQLKKDLKQVAGDVNFKNVHFYKANLADLEQTKATWERILRDHGVVHILVNNHAICQGKRVDELSIERFKLTMDINFNSYVHLTMLFLDQVGIAEEREADRFHLCNVNSIAGHMTCQRNSDYSASKFALTGFTDALRQELEFKGSPVKMTNFYPYYIDTGLFEGFKPTMRFIMPTLKAEKVTRRMHQAIMAEEKEVYIEPIIWWLKNVTHFMPLALKTRLARLLVG